MTITHIYDHYHIPLNLQQHMLRVAAVGKIVCQHLQDISFNQDLITKTLLLHDMGNILKIDMDNPKFFAKADKTKIDFYRQVQQDYADRYGPNADQATLEIISEITDNQQIKQLCSQSHGNHVKDFLHTDKWNHKIVYYSDMRIGPNGILTVDNRFADLIKRYPNEVKHLETYHQECKTIEQQLQTHADFNLQTITDNILEKQFNKLKKIDI